jgi:hypothetical protein
MRPATVVVCGVLLLPFWLVASIILGQDVFGWLEERKR